MANSDALTEGSTAHPRGSGTSGRADLIGRTISGTYVIERRIGSGGMGVVYRARHAHDGYAVAIKCVHPELARDATVARRFVQETQAAAQIRHDHVVQILERGQLEDGSPYIVMEHLDGEELAAVLDREGPLPWRRAAHIARQIASALMAAHAEGIVHRDIKPANCLRLREPAPGDLDTIKVLDFGLARLDPALREHGESLTSTGVVMGTPGYIAPEVYRGFKADARADIYALGVLTYRLLEDDLPPFKVPDTALARVPSSLRAVILRCMHHDPEDRYASAEQVHDALVQLLHVPTEGPTVEEMMAPTPAVEEARRVILGPPPPAMRVSLPTPASGTSVQAMPRRRRPWLWIGGAALVGVVAIAALNFGGPPVDRVVVTPAAVGSLMIELSPVQATVTIDGVARSEVGSRRVIGGLPAGPHRVEVAAGAAYLPFSRDVYVAADQHETLRADLAARDVVLTVTTEPANSVVRVIEGDNARVLAGRGGDDFRVERKPGVPYKVVAELEGYGSNVAPLTFSGNAKDRVHVVLIKDRVVEAPAPAVVPAGE